MYLDVSFPTETRLSLARGAVVSTGGWEEVSTTDATLPHKCNNACYACTIGAPMRQGGLAYRKGKGGVSHWHSREVSHRNLGLKRRRATRGCRRYSGGVALHCATKLLVSKDFLAVRLPTESLIRVFKCTICLPTPCRRPFSEYRSMIVSAVQRPNPCPTSHLA